MSDSVLSTVDQALQDYAAGRMIIVVDDEDRENEGDLVLAADHVSAEAINFMVTHGRGLVCLAMSGRLLDRLQIPLMVPQVQNRSGFGTGFTVSVEAAEGVSTGISAADRAHTVKTLIDPASTPADIASPGHIFPLRARDGGVLERRGQTEAAVDMAVLSGLTPAGVICEVMRKDGDMMRLDDLGAYARHHGLKIISVEQLAHYRLTVEGDANHVSAPRGFSSQTRQRDTTDSQTNPPDKHPQRSVPGVTLAGKSHLPTAYGDFDIQVFRDRQGLEHSALIKRSVTDTVNEPVPLVRLHSECLTGDAFGSLRCDCGEQLQSALRLIEASGNGVLLYLRQEGRGIGLGNKIRAYELQEAGRDTVDANLELGFPADARQYDVAADMLRVLGIQEIRLLSNNPDKQQALEAEGIRVHSRLPLIIEAQPHNEKYLNTKAEKFGHSLPTRSALSD